MEATSFTPWLLANSGLLGDVLGLDLELKQAEHKVGEFSLDLLGSDTESDAVVIVENQFGSTDHRHLGQILTYAGGTNPQIVVWIAEHFRDEHRAALDWLNQRTDSNTRFFGVQLRAVTLEGAPQGLVAPLLEVLVKPNDWGKRVKTTTNPTPSPREQLYVDFWSQWLTKVKVRGWTNRKPPPRHFVYLPSGSPAARYVCSFRSDGLLSALFFHHENPAVNLERWTRLKHQQLEMEQAFGGTLVFEDLPTRKGCRVGTKRSNGESIEDTDKWGNYHAWLEDTQARLRTAIAAAGGIPGLPVGPEVEESAHSHENI
jgi:hypothetical protein